MMLQLNMVRCVNWKDKCIFSALGFHLPVIYMCVCTCICVGLNLFALACRRWWPFVGIIISVNSNWSNADWKNKQLCANRFLLRCCKKEVWSCSLWCTYTCVNVMWLLSVKHWQCSTSIMSHLITIYIP